MDLDTFWREQQTARYLNIRVKTLQQWRCTGKGPPYHRFGRLIRYKAAEVCAWADAQCASQSIIKK